jgi:hypothetical protein
MFKRAASMPLLLTDDSSTGAGGGDGHKVVPLYDANAMTELASTVCQGYITLLTGAVEQARGSSDKETQERVFQLAYAALTDGNVIDACFGVRISSKKNSAINTLIQEAKRAVDDAVSSNEHVGRVAIDAYKNGFGTVISMNKKLSKLNILTKCFLEKKIRNAARSKLATDFLQLEQAVTSAS